VVYVGVCVCVCGVGVVWVVWGVGVVWGWCGGGGACVGVCDVCGVCVWRVSCVVLLVGVG
jgi:hypothetical protein